MTTGQIMHQQSTINTSRQISDLPVIIRRFAWVNWLSSLALAGFALLLVLDGVTLPSDAMRLPFPPVLHLALLLIPLLLLLPQRATLGTPTIVMTAVAIELLATLVTIGHRMHFAILTDLPQPTVVFFAEYRHGVVAGAALLVLVIAFAVAWTSYRCRHDRRTTIIFFLLLGLYGLARLLTGFCYGLPLEQPLLVWSIAAAVPTGLALGLLTACFVNRFWPPPESLPQAP